MKKSEQRADECYCMTSWIVTLLIVSTIAAFFIGGFIIFGGRL